MIEILVVRSYVLFFFFIRFHVFSIVKIAHQIVSMNEFNARKNILSINLTMKN